MWPRFESQKIESSLKQTVTVQPFDLQRLTVPLWKDIDSVANISSAQEIKSIQEIVFALLKSPNLHRAYLATTCNQRLIAVKEF